MTVVASRFRDRRASRYPLGDSRYSRGYFDMTWIFRISRSSADAISVIRAGHYAVGVIPNIHSCANSVMNLSTQISLFSRGNFASRGKRDDPP